MGARAKIASPNASQSGRRNVACEDLTAQKIVSKPNADAREKARRG
jgi:hypothetical protein